MVQTKKFSQFNVGGNLLPTDIIVGLRNGDNYQFNAPAGGGGGGGSVTIIVDQPGHNLQPGNWVRVNNAGLYVLALADTPEHAEIAGTVLNVINANQFTLQVIGFVPDGTFVGLTPGSVYFLSDVVPGLMVLAEPIINGEVSIPVFIAVTATSGWIRQWRGFIIGGQPPNGGGGGGGTNPNIVTINQPGHGLNVSQIVRLAGDTIYVPAQANTLANSQAVGVVIQVIDANNFVLQTEGYNIGAITVDDLGNPVVPTTVYYLSATLAGSITAIPPATVGQATKPIFICEHQVGVSRGYILEQRPLAVSAGTTDPNIVTVNQPGHGLNVGDWVYVSGSLTYTRGLATALNTSQVVGVVINVVNANQFILQTNGYNVGAVTLDDAGNPIVPSTIYYLSATVAGRLAALPPATVGQYTKPLFACEQTFGITGINAGYVLEQRPLIVPAPVVPGSGWTLISTTNIAPATTNVNVLNITGFFRYMLILENLVPTGAVANGFGIWIRTSSNNGVSFDAAAGNYSFGNEAGTIPFAGATSISIPLIDQLTNPPFPVGITGSTSAISGSAAGGLSGYINILNPGNLTTFKSMQFSTNYIGYNSNQCYGGNVKVGYRLSAAIINALNFRAIANSGAGPVVTFDSGRIILLGTNS